MFSSDIPSEVLDFLSDQISSMEQLEVLLLLSGHADREWTAEAVFAEIQSSQASINQRLEEFQHKGLLISPQPNVYRYSPRTHALDKAVRALATVYKEKRVKVIELIYRKPLDNVQSFADAFRIRKDNPNG